MTDLLGGSLSLVVLATVARLGDDAYGLAIRRAVCERMRHDYSVGAIYTTLTRLESKGLLGARQTEPLPVRGGRSRRQFHLTSAGVAALRAARERESAQWADLDHLFTMGRAL